MKKLFTAFILIFPLILFSQDKEDVDWITENSIEIEDVNPNSELEIFKQSIPNKFANARIFGFGEASHNTKEFFDLKAKFFKYLVKNHSVKIFIMEDIYQAEAGINEWITGGKGDIKKIANNFGMGFWRTKEVVNLLQWMRDYNLDKTKDDQIRFFGMDIQAGKGINKEIREFVYKYKIPIDEELLISADSCANKQIDYSIKDDFWQTQLLSLKKLKQQLLKQEIDGVEYKAITRSLNYLISYTEYASTVNEIYPTSTELRDLKMFENVKFIAENESKNGKVFIWAHNDHINKKEMYSTGSNIKNLGRHLKDYYKDDFYSVGFDFGIGKIDGFVSDKKRGDYWKTYDIKKPFRNTYAETLMVVDKNVYFVELNESSKFFNKKFKYLIIAAGGYEPKPLYKVIGSKVYAETYDGLIFVKSISVPEPLY